MSDCDCGAAGYWSRHDPGCEVVKLRKRPRIDCVNCELDDQPAASANSWFRDNDWCAHCEANYEPPDTDGEDYRGGEAEAHRDEQLHRMQRDLK